MGKCGKAGENRGCLFFSGVFQVFYKEGAGAVAIRCSLCDSFASTWCRDTEKARFFPRRGLCPRLFLGSPCVLWQKTRGWEEELGLVGGAGALCPAGQAPLPPRAPELLLFTHKAPKKQPQKREGKKTLKAHILAAL